MEHNARLLDTLNEYNRYFDNTVWVASARKRHPVRNPSLRIEKNRKALERLLEICDRHSIDPKKWVYALFAKVKFRRPPKLEALADLKHLEYVRTAVPSETFAYRERAQYQRNHHLVFDPNTDLNPGIEQYKQRLLATGQANWCMVNSAETLGHNANSGVCRSCPLAAQCAAQKQQGLAPRPFPYQVAV